MDMKEIKRAGADALFEDKSTDACPYEWGTEEFYAWMEGWGEAREASNVEEYPDVEE